MLKLKTILYRRKKKKLKINLSLAGKIKLEKLK